METVPGNPQVIYTWKASLRPFKKRSRLILRFYLSAALLVTLIIFFFGDRILLVPVWAVLFLFYVLTITPPPEVENKITKFGLEAAGVTLRWESLSYFFFSRRFGFTVLTVVGHAPYYFHAYMVVPDEEVKKKVTSLLAERLVYQEKRKKTLTDKIIDWLSQLIPDEEDYPAPDAATPTAPLSPQTLAPNK
ncbi:hypothetical protein HY214_01565 [Candidatus Roizmanbacteria bacterium]|nr:hypothetical protein [Candidatus Roizmanbacteria bacterium]